MSKFLFKLILFAAVFPLFADVPVARISDDSQLRIRLRDAWFYDTPANVLSRRSAIEQLPSGEKVEVRAVNGRNEIMVLLSRENSLGEFPGWTQGSWMLTRRRDTGAGVLIRIFLRSDQFTYIDLKPLSTDKAQMDVVLYGGFMARSLPIAVPFERLYTMQLNEILRLAGDKFPRKYFDPDLAMYRDSQRFITQVRQRLGEIRYADDGAIDENGNFIFIETLERQPSGSAGVNCSGFAKWLIDGCLRPITGKRLSVSALKMPFGDRGSSFTANWENRPSEGIVIPLDHRRDPHFGLDWIRNLAAEANGTLRSSSHRALEEFEVRGSNFSQILVNENRSFVIHNYPGFLSEAGYGFEGLHALLYTLAIDYPFSFYLAAINNEIGSAVTAQNPRGSPRLRQYYHIAALIPYFDENGNFRVVVFESATESSFSGFNRRYPGHYINLVQIPVPSRFDP
ncbi:MAG: hypothetical protein LBU88_04440 [Treponema sp.]|jgi:hypothetical protein|nr:hypothetical protein [Treponema sp.]